MQVSIDENSGFCFGVVYAIAMAEDALDENGQLYCLGDIVHNDVEVKRLEEKGLEIIDHKDLKNLRNTKVLIRAHGEAPETYKTAMANNIELIDASCPVVLKLQNRVKNSFDKVEQIGGQIVIFGKPGHAEVTGLLGQTLNKAVVIFSEEDLHKIDYTKPIHFYSQTTKSTAKFYALKEEIIKRATEAGNESVEASDTICRQVSNREPQLRKFASAHDVVIFVAGKKSSNGKVLYGVCRETNERSHFISDVSEIDETWFEGAKSVGICGATSTPFWLMEEVKTWVKSKIRIN